MWINIHNTSLSVINRALKHSTLLNLKPKGRGKHQKHRRISEDLKMSISDHIKSYKTLPSHYTTTKSGVEYFEGGMFLTKLWKEFTEKNEDHVHELPSFEW